MNARRELEDIRSSSRVTGDAAPRIKRAKILTSSPRRAAARPQPSQARSRGRPSAYLLVAIPRSQPLL